MGLFDFLKKKDGAPESAPEVAALVAKLKHSDWKVRFEAETADALAEYRSMFEGVVARIRNDLVVSHES